MKNWFVLNTKPKKEFHVEKIFTNAGFLIYNPTYMKDGRVVPFFPGYEFIQFDFPDQYKLVKYTRGVKRIIGNQEGPIPLQEHVIHQIKTREVDGQIELDKYGEKPEIGDEIEVMEGPMKGLKGVFKEEMSGKNRVLILLNYVSYQGRIVLEKKKLRKLKR